MSAHLQDTYPITLDLQRLGKMLLGYCHTLNNRGLWQNLACREVVFALAENPRAAISGTTNHHAINAIAVEHLVALLGRIDIAITDNGDCDAWVVLNLAYQSPVRIATIHLRASTAMNGKCRNANILQTERNLLDILHFV